MLSTSGCCASLAACLPPAWCSALFLLDRQGFSSWSVMQPFVWLARHQDCRVAMLPISQRALLKIVLETAALRPAGLYLQSVKQLASGMCYIWRPAECCTQALFFIG